MKGTYILVIELRKDSGIRVGSLGTVAFRKGFYAYVGSGMGSLEKRVERHLKKRGKKKFWHIDYLLVEGRVQRAFVWESAEREECETAKILVRGFESVARFGCSDCGCGSHLFFSKSHAKMEKAALGISRSFRARRSLLRWRHQRTSAS
jgi:Uri superfamily endonuclease